jgi:MoaA/NifB/PqqE/SkfB family radical SAM enzyme
VLYYYIGILRKLSILKIWNYLLLFTSFYASKFKKTANLRGMPFFISVEPTTSCNLRCPQCPSGLRQFSRPKGMLEPEFFDTIIDQVKSRLFGLTFYFQGEPYLNPDFLRMVKSTSAKGIYTSTSTNAHYLTPENARQTVDSGLDKITISVDGISQESYERYRVGGDLEKVLEGTKEETPSCCLAMCGV